MIEQRHHLCSVKVGGDKTDKNKDYLDTNKEERMQLIANRMEAQFGPADLMLPIDVVMSAALHSEGCHTCTYVLWNLECYPERPDVFIAASRVFLTYHVIHHHR